MQELAGLSKPIASTVVVAIADDGLVLSAGMKLSSRHNAQLWGWMIGSSQASIQSWTLLANYFPQRAFKARFLTACSEIAAAHAETPFVIVGDLNTGNQLGERITERNDGFYRCNQCKQDFTVRTGTIFERSDHPPDRSV